MTAGDFIGFCLYTGFRFLFKNNMRRWQGELGASKEDNAKLIYLIEGIGLNRYQARRILKIQKEHQKPNRGKYGLIDSKDYSA